MVKDLFSEEIIFKVKEELKSIALDSSVINSADFNEINFQGYYLMALLFKHLHKLDVDIPYTINTDNNNKRTRNHLFLNLNHTDRSIVYFMPIEAVYNVKQDSLNLKFPDSPALYSFFTKKVVSLEAVLEKISTPHYMISICDFLFELESIRHQLNIKVSDSVLDHLFFFNREPFIDTTFIYNKNGITYNAKYLSNQLKHPFFSSNSSLWHKYKYKVKNFNAIYYPAPNEEIWEPLVKHVSCWKYYSSFTSSKLSLHPLYLNQVKINRLVKFINNYPESFLETFWNDIIKQEVILKLNMKSILNHRLSHIYDFLKNKFTLQESVLFLEKNRSQDPFFWGILEAGKFDANKINTIKELEEFLIQERNAVYNVEIQKLDISHNNFKELVSTQQLIEEGISMKHCVGGKWRLLESGTKFFHIKTGLLIKDHSTLEIKYQYGSWVRIEHKSKSNNQPPDKHVDLARELIDKLNSKKR